MPVIAIVFVLVPAGVFGLVGELVTGDGLYLMPLLIAGAAVGVSHAKASTPAALCAPLDRFHPPTPPPDPGDRWLACTEAVVYGLFLLAPYGAMAWVIGRHFF